MPMDKKKHELLKEFKIIYRNSVTETKYTISQEVDKINHFIKEKFNDVKQDIEDLAVYFDEKFSSSKHHKSPSKTTHNHKSKK
jgi:hypothetical protein